MLTDEEDDDGVQDCVTDGDIVLSKEWHDHGKLQMEQVTDKQLVEYIMAKDIHMLI